MNVYYNIFFLSKHEMSVYAQNLSRSRAEVIWRMNTIYFVMGKEEE